MATKQEISEKTGFDSGEKFENEQQVRDYFTVDSMNEMYGGNLKNDFPELCDQSVLDSMANDVIENKWHCNF